MGGAGTGFALSGGNPIGALVGGGAGLLGGLFGGSSSRQLQGYDERNRSLWDSINGAQGRPGAQIGQYERSGGGQDFRSGQLALVKQLQDQAAGRGPSLAGLQARQAADAGMAQNLAMAAGAAPGNEALAMRGAMQNNAGMTQNLAMTSAQARMAEQLSAQQQLAGALGQGRGMDLQNEQFNAGMTNQRLLEQARLQQQNRALNDSYGMGLRGLELQNAQAQMGGQTPNTFGTQMMSGGANLLSMYGMGAFGGSTYDNAGNQVQNPNRGPGVHWNG
jgi:hypothetical protein